MSLTLKILSILYRRYERDSSLELISGDIELLLFTDNEGYPLRVLMYLKDTSPQRGCWYTRKSLIDESDRIMKYIWQKDL
jgi:hypothetical protein